jgi:ADP-heptose:LPS heptosyltransferase
MIQPKKICVIHLNQIGDLVFSLPLLKALRDNYPQAQIHSVIRPYLTELVAFIPYVDKVIPRQDGFFKLMGEIRTNRYDLLISLSASSGCMIPTAFSKAGYKAGFNSFPWDLSLDIKEKIEGHHSWRNNLKIMKRLELKIAKEDYVGLFKLPSKDLKDIAGFTSTGKYVVISPGTSLRRTVKAWEDDKFAELIIALKEKHSLDSVLVGGKENIEPNEKIIRLVKEKGGDKVNRILDITGKVSLNDLCYVLRDASLFVGVDSGLMHLASALDKPLVGLFGPTDTHYVGPLNKSARVVQHKELECVPCYLKGCESRQCMTKISVSEVLDKCAEVLSE